VPLPLDAARDAVTAVQARVVEVLAAENARLAGQVTDLAARVERLERLISRNSGNSSMPPSADDLPGRTRPRRQPLAGGSGSRASSRVRPGHTWPGARTRTSGLIISQRGRVPAERP